MAADRILDIDIGNTRIKWRCGEARGALRASDDWSEWRRELPEALQRVRVANVTGSEVAGRLSDWLGEQFGVEPEFAVTAFEAAGVRCAYADPSTLGIDRWLGLLAVRARVAGDAVVVSAGSAVTVDLLRADGAHLGGYIVPGLELQRKSLFAGTSDVKVVADWRSGRLGAGESTEQAVIHGSLAMVVGLIERARTGLSGDVSVVVAGGDADYLLPHLGSACHWPELVMDGLAVALP